MVSSPPADSIRSRMLDSPVPAAVVTGSKPMPSSSTRKVSLPSRPRGTPGSRLAPECLAAFCTASRQQKYAAASTSAGTGRRPAARDLDRDRAGGDRRAQRRDQALGPSWRRVDAAGQRRPGRRSPRPPPAPARPAAPRPRSRDRGASVSASRRFTARATRCCWAPSWMSRSSRRRSASWASTRRWRDVRSSSARAESSSTRCGELGAEPGAAQHRPGLGGEPGEQSLLDRGERPVLVLPARRSTPSSSPAWPTERPVPSRRRDRPRVGVLAGRLAPGGQVAASAGQPPTTSHTCAHSAPVPSASTFAIRAGSSSRVVAAGDGLGERPQHVVRRRLAAVHRRRRRPRSSRVCTGSKPSATTAVASTERATSGEDVCPISTPPPSTTTT